MAERHLRLVSTAPYTLTMLPEKKLRSAGWHCGQVVNDLGTKIGKLPRQRKRSKADDYQKFAYFDAGFTWEDSLEAEFVRRQQVRSDNDRAMRHLKGESQVELYEDGFFMTLDYLWRTKGGVAKQLDEYKMTWTYPPKKPEELFDRHWGWRVCSHNYALAAGVNRVRFIVCFARDKPTPVEYIFEYDEKDMKADRQLVVRHMERLERQQKERAA